MKHYSKLIISTLIIAFAFIVIVIIALNNWSYRAMHNAKLSTKELMIMRDELLIRQYDFSWLKPLVDNNKPSKIIFHHAAINTITAEQVNKLHQDKGWNGIGYHYFISKDGIISEGRPENAEGAHTIGQNNSSIGICVEGNLEEEEITNEQLDSVIKLGLYICLKYDIKEIEGHKNYSNTKCPGENFPLDNIRNIIIEKVKNIGVNKNYM